LSRLIAVDAGNRRLGDLAPNALEHSRLQTELSDLREQRRDILFSHFYATCSSNEIYSVQVSESKFLASLANRPFHIFCFEALRFEMVPIAIKVGQDTDHRGEKYSYSHDVAYEPGQVMLNPGKRYVVRDQDTVYYIARASEEAMWLCEKETGDTDDDDDDFDDDSLVGSGDDTGGHVHLGVRTWLSHETVLDKDVRRFAQAALKRQQRLAQMQHHETLELVSSLVLAMPVTASTLAALASHPICVTCSQPHGP
jgi:hypothetical protein